jgi:hypothetical protein
MSESQPNISAVVSLQHIVANFLNERNDYSQAEFKRLLQIAIMGFSNLNMTSLRSYDVAYLTPDDKGQCVLPADFVDYIKIGGNLGGKMYTLTMNKEIIINQQILNGDIVNESYNVDDTITDEQALYLPHTVGGYLITNLYGYSYSGGLSTTSSMFNIDYDNKLIQLSSTLFVSQLIVEYISTGVSLSVNTYIPRYCEIPMVEYLHWRTRKSDGKFSRGEVMDSKQDYLEAVAVIETLEKMPTYQEIMDVFYGTSKQTIKR